MDDAPHEQYHEHRPRDLSFYLTLIFIVCPIYAVIPLSWLYLLHCLYYGAWWSYTPKGYVVLTFACAEVLFSVYHYILARRISGPSPIPVSDILDLQDSFKRVLSAGLVSINEGSVPSLNPDSILQSLEHDDPRAVDFRDCLRTWFRKHPWSSIKRQEVYQWLYWSIFNAALPPWSQIPPSHQTVLQEALAMLEHRSGCTIPDGSNDEIQPLLLTVDPVKVTHRPLAWYLFVKTANYFALRAYESSHKIYRRSYRGLEFLMRIPPGYDIDNGPPPVIFLHGLGLGVVQYTRILTHLLNELPDQPLVIPLQPHISQDFFHPRHLHPISRVEIVEALLGLSTELGWVGNPDKKRQGVTIMSHSNGSYAHAWMLKAYPEAVTKSCFVDPVTFCSWEGDVCYNFIYRRCSNAIELLMSYFVGTELGVANLLQRHFDWSSNALWFDEIPNARDPEKTLFLVGGKDAIVNAARVKKYLQSHGVNKNLWFDPHGRHGQALLPGSENLVEVIRWLKTYPED